MYAGGDFTLAGETAVEQIAKWDGSSWSALSEGLNGRVFALTVYDDGSGEALYAAGDFTRADGNVVNHIAKWDGIDWIAAGIGTNATIRSMTVFEDGTGHGEALYVGGTFTTAGVVDANRMAFWDGQSWFPMDVGTNNPVFGLTSSQSISAIGPALYAGGSFLSAGDLTTNYIARWKGCFDRPGDFNGDGFTDLDDYSSFLFCMNGPDAGIPTNGEIADIDLDGDVDLRDAAVIQNFFFP